MKLYSTSLKKIRTKIKPILHSTGKKFWQPIKKILSESDWKAKKWKTTSKVKYDRIMKMPESFTDVHGHNEIIEINHFFDTNCPHSRKRKSVAEESWSIYKKKR